MNKCKEHYIDCINVVSYNVTDMCSKLKILWHIMIHDKNNLFSCPILMVSVININLTILIIFIRINIKTSTLIVLSYPIQFILNNYFLITV